MDVTRPRRLFVAGATGVTGRLLVRLARERGVDVVPHVRPQSASRAPEGAEVLDLADRAALVRALSSCTTVVQLIGTTRQRFSKGDTYATSDVGTTRELVDAAKESGVDHLVLLSSVGAGKPRGAYLRAKADAEKLVTGSGLAFTIFRPSVFVGDSHQPPKLLVALGDFILSAKYRSVRVDALASAILASAVERAPVDAILEGRSLHARLARS